MRNDVDIRIGGNTAGLQASLAKAGMATKKWSGMMKGFVAVAVGGAFAKMILNVAKTGMEFEKEMKRVKAISGATAKQFGELEKKAREMGATTEFTATQSAEGLRFLAMAGLSVEQQLVALPQALDLATIGMMSMGEAADISTNIMSMYGLQAEDLGRVNDIVAKTASSSNTSVRELAEAIKYAGPLAKSLNFSLEDTSAFLGLLANRGIKASMAGTTIAQSMRKLLNPTGKAVDIMEKYNINMEGIQEGTKTYTDVLKQMIGSQMTAAEGAKLLGVRAGLLQSLFSMTTEEVDEFVESIRKSQGASKEMANTIRSGLHAEVKKLASVWQEMKLKIYDGLEPIFKLIVELAINAVKNITISIEAAMKGIHWFGEKILEAWHTVMDVIGMSIDEVVKTKLADEIDEITERIKMQEEVLASYKRKLASAEEGKFIDPEKNANIQRYKDQIQEYKKLIEQDKRLLELRGKTLGSFNRLTEGHMGALPPLPEGTKVLKPETGVGDGTDTKDKKQQIDYLGNEIAYTKIKLGLMNEERQEYGKLGREAQDYYRELTDKLSYLKQMKEDYGYVSKDMIDSIRVEDNITKEITENMKKAAKVNEDFNALQKKLKDDADDATDAIKAESAAIADTFLSAFQSAEQGIEGAKNALKNFFVEIAIQMAKPVISDFFSKVAGGALGSLAGPFAGLAGGLFGSIFGGLFHSGGVVGQSGVPQRAMPALAFAGAPRLHNGLMPGEFPAILQRGETVVPRDKSVAGNISNTKKTNNTQYIDLRNSQFWNQKKLNETIALISRESVKRNASKVIINDYYQDKSIRSLMKRRP